MYAGIAAIVVSCLLFIIFYIVPLVKILRYPAFQTNVNAKTARAAQKHNRAVRHEVAEKIIDFTAKVEGAGWYDSAVVGAMAIALKTGDEASLMKAMTALYGDSVKKSAKDLIFRGALKSASYSALSQTSRVDALLVAFINLQLVKDLVFLYGFRPSDARLVKIFCRVLQNSLIAYGRSERSKDYGRRGKGHTYFRFGYFNHSRFVRTGTDKRRSYYGYRFSDDKVSQL